MGRNAGRRAIGVAACVATMLAFIPRPAMTVLRTQGKARTANTIVALTIGDDLAVSVGVDEALSEQTTNAQNARASFKAGVARQADEDPEAVGDVERKGDRSADTGTDSARHGRVKVPGLVSLTIVEATAGVTLRSDRVTSNADAVLSNIDLAEGLIAVDGLRSSSGARVDADESKVTRSISIDQVELFDLGELLDRLGVDPLALACEAIEDAGSELGVDTSAACAQATAARDALTDATDELGAVEAELEAIIGPYDPNAIAAARDQAAALACDPLDVVCRTNGIATLLAIASSYSVTISDPTNLDSTRADVVSGLSTLYDRVVAATSDLSVVRDAANEAADGTCSAVDDALADAIDGISSTDPAGAAAQLETAREGAAAACEVFAATVADLLDTPLVTLDDIKIKVTTIARKRNPVADVEATIGSISLGLGTPLELPDVTEVTDTVATIEGALGDTLAALGIDAPLPQVELFVIEKKKGRHHGTWFADATVTTLRIRIPSATLDVPSPTDLAILDDVAIPALGAKAARFAPMADVSSPAVKASVGVFDAAATFAPFDRDVKGEHRTRNQTSGETLPVTGLGDWLAVLAAAMLMLGGLVRRALIAIR